METNRIITLQIAGLDLELNARDSGVVLAVPFIYEKFLKERLLFGHTEGGGGGLLSLSIHSDKSWMEKSWGVPICLTKIWELWRDQDGQYVFVSPRQIPPKSIKIDPNFRTGEVLGDFSSIKGEPIYPLSSIDIRIMVNWLAGFGDLILHSAGVGIDGQGYCFIGESGVGKSTLAAVLAKESSVTVLGEDQVILRYVDGKFWIYGTPWHEHVEMCSPVGVPLKKIFFLDREIEPHIKMVSPSEGMIQILQTAFVPYYLHDKIQLIMEQLTLLGEAIPFFSLKYKLGSDILPSIVM